MLICLFKEIKIFAKKLITIKKYKNSFEINRLCEISKFKFLKISKVSFLLNNNGEVITREPLKK